MKYFLTFLIANNVILLDEGSNYIVDIYALCLNIKTHKLKQYVLIDNELLLEPNSLRIFGHHCIPNRTGPSSHWLITWTFHHIYKFLVGYLKYIDNNKESKNQLLK